MKQKLLATLLCLLLASCVPAQTTSVPKPTSTALIIPTRMPFPTRISNQPVDATPTSQPGLLDHVHFLDTFSIAKADWDIVPGHVTAEQVNQAVATLEGAHVSRQQQKVINGFLRTTVTQVGGQAYEVLLPAEIVDGKLKPLKVKSVEQTPVLATHGFLAEDYFAIHYPDVVGKWEAQGARYEDFKYAAIITITWATKYGPLRMSYKLSGKYIYEEGLYPGRVDYLRLCMFESTRQHFLPNGRLDSNLYPLPIVGLSGTTKDTTGSIESDAFGWTPMVDFATAESETLSWIAQSVSGIPIESKETLAELQAAFNRVFMPVHCSEVSIN